MNPNIRDHEASSFRHNAGRLAQESVGVAPSGAAELREGAHHAVEAAKDMFVGAKDLASEQYAGAKKATVEAIASVRDVITRNPVASIGVAAGVGFVVGLLLFRHRS
jgi:ElaB/YqjD/DUF883 family membrane-anchored ribosome-binding protein